jgi:mono/diheme cytochrome c family protein
MRFAMTVALLSCLVLRAGKAHADGLPPVLTQRCVSCHGPAKQKGGLRLDTLTFAAKGGDSGAIWNTDKPAESALLARVQATDSDRMPPVGNPLTVGEIDQLRGWLDTKPWLAKTETVTSDHWAYQPIREPRLPTVNDPAWSRSPIDRFVLDGLRKQGLTPSARADRRTLIRRVSLDLIGLPPTPVEVAAFEADNAPNAYEKLVDRLLASPRHGERWARHWLDVVRFAESNGFETNTARPNAWPYRDWVIGALNADMPYDQFLKLQLAGDQWGEPVATGFLVGGPWDEVKSPDIGLTSQQRADELADMTGTVGSAFLGLTVACARCHAHKFDPITQTDYHAMVACLAGVEHGNRPLPLAPDKAALLAAKTQTIQRLEKELATHTPAAGQGRLVLSGPGQVMQQPTGRTELETGTARGHQGDAGAWNRWPTVSGGYFWWEKPGDNLVWSHKPGLSGKWRVWASWGTGWQTHAPDARLVLDADGNPATKDDRRELLVVDQRLFADGSPAGNGKKLWSGWRLAGEMDLQPGSLIGWARGQAGGVVTASDLLFEQVTADTVSASQPHGRPPVSRLANSERFAPRQARFVRMTIRATNGGSEPCIDELEIFGPAGDTNLAPGANVTSSGDYPGNAFHKLSHIHDGIYGNAKSWISNTPGKGVVTLELRDPVRINRIVWSRDRGEMPPNYADRVASDYTLETSVDGVTWQFAAGSQDRVPASALAAGTPWLPRPGIEPAEATRMEALEKQLGQLRAEVAGLGQGKTAYIGRLTQPGPTKRFHRGDPLQPREEVQPGGIAAIGPPLKLEANLPEAQRRMKLAEWITDPAHPLTRRVIVNRLWQHHFGEGLVNTPSDFGANGGRPSHPELLDWLAVELARQGWSLKKLHRQMVLSEAYCQASLPRADAMAKDAGNRWLWRFSPRRLEAEPLRDSILAISGNLDLTMGGPGFDLFEPNTNYVKVYKAKESFGPAEWRRMIYQAKPRMQLDGVFGAFDCPDAGQVTARRGRSITPLQALNLLNSRFLLDQSKILADRLRREAPAGSAAQVDRAFALFYSRAPDDAERVAGIELIGSAGLDAFCRALFNTSEWIWVE